MLGAAVRVGNLSFRSILNLGNGLTVVGQDSENEYIDNLGITLSEQGRYPEAETAYRQVLRLDPTDAVAHNNLGNALLYQQRYPEAEASYRIAIRLDPNYALPQNGLGYLFQAQGRYREAIAQDQRVLEINPNYTLAQRNLAEAQRLLGQ